MWYRWYRDRGVSILCGTGRDWDRGVFRLGGTGGDSGQVSVQLNQSTCPKVGQQDREIFIATDRALRPDYLANSADQRNERPLVKKIHRNREIAGERAVGVWVHRDS